jgi:hypothetical protein
VNLYTYYKKWLIREWILRFEPNGAQENAGSIQFWITPVDDALDPNTNPLYANECVNASAAVTRQWNIPISAFGPTEKWVIAPSEKKTHTGEVDGLVACLLVESLDAGVLPGRLVGKLTMKLIVKLIEPVLRKDSPKH